MSIWAAQARCVFKVVPVMRRALAPYRLWQGLELHAQAAAAQTAL
jgi:hypothetical protein